MERRQFPRKTVNLPVVCEAYHWPSSGISGKAVDISQGGVGLRLSKPLNRRGTVRVKISDRSSGIEIEAEGKIAWYKTIESGEGRIGIDFTKIAWTRLQELLKRV